MNGITANENDRASLNADSDILRELREKQLPAKSDLVIHSQIK
jgi:hypothetical protein